MSARRAAEIFISDYGLVKRAKPTNSIIKNSDHIQKRTPSRTQITSHPDGDTRTWFDVMVDRW